MLNPSLPENLYDEIKSPYVLPYDLIKQNISDNEGFNSGEENRVQKIYGQEIWTKLERAGITKKKIKKSKVLEICAGNGFLTYHIIKSCKPEYFSVNDISSEEIKNAKLLLLKSNLKANINWKVNDFHTLEESTKYDIIIGNSFLHHFYDVPGALSKICNLLEEGGIFISLHEPSIRALPIESGKILAYFLSIFKPKFVNHLFSNRRKNNRREKDFLKLTDIWMFESRKLKEVAYKAGFNLVRTLHWNLLHAFIANKFNLHLNHSKTRLSKKEILLKKIALKIDGFLNRFLSGRFFGSICLICQKKHLNPN